MTGASARVIVIAALAMVGTLPGRTQGLGLITEPLLADLQIDRLSYATINLWATIVGSAGALGVGRLIDRAGSGPVLTAVALALGVVVAAMTRVASLPVLAVLITLTRGLGQSALSVVSLATIGKSFVGRIDRAMAIYSIVMSIGFMIAFPIVGALVQSHGWRTAWLAVAVVLLLVIAPLGWLLPGRGRMPAEMTPTPSTESGDGDTLGYALRTGAFWVFAAGTALYGLVASGIGLFNESILAERGFGPDVYYQTLIVTAMTALLGNFLGGWLANTVSLGRLLAISLGVLAAGLIGLPHVTSLAHVMIWATAMGLGGGLVMVLFFSVWPRVFGRRHLGRIQGAAQALTVLASAIGPLLLAWSVDRTGTYTTMFRLLAGTIAAVGIAALLVRVPARAR